MKSRLIVSAGAVALFAGLAFGSTASAKPAVVKIGSFTPPKAIYLRETIKPWLRAMERDSDGTLKFQEFWGGALIRSPRKQWEGLLNGIQDAAQILPAYTAKLFPDFTFYSLPFLFRGTGSVEGTVAGWNMYKRGLIGGLEKVHVLAVYSNDNSGLHFNRSIKSLDDAKGMKVRVPGAGQANVAKLLGLVPVGMGMPQVAESLNRGVIQGTMTGWSALRTFRVTPLIKSHIDIPLGSRSFFIAIHNRVYNKLPAKAKASIAKHEGLDFSLKMGRYYEGVGSGLRTKTGNRNVIRLSEAEQQKMEALFKPVHDAWIAKTKDGAKKYKALREILAAHRAGKK